MKIAIAGYGIEGESNYNYFKASSNDEVTIIDQKTPEREIPSDVELLVGQDVFRKLDDFDLVVRTASLSPSKIKTNGKIWSATNEFFSKCPATIIGVTGTKGKGTTASIIASILEAAGKKVWLIGNIGKPALDYLDMIRADDIVVYELSSFQLWDLEKSPKVAVILYIEQEHLDVHADMQDYIAAKSNITKYQTGSDLLVYNKSNIFASDIAKTSKAQKVGYQDSEYAHIEKDSFFYGEQLICSTRALRIIGDHNIDNACAAIDSVWSIVSNPKIIELGLSKFTGLPHRLQFVREFEGVNYFDDSIATTPSSAIAALRSFNIPKVIILGGSSKGSDFTELGIELTKHDAKAILIGDEADNIASSCRNAGFADYEILKGVNTDFIVEKARQLSSPGGVVLLSPASASFGLYKNYVDRGEQFIAAVNKLS